MKKQERRSSRNDNKLDEIDSTQDAGRPGPFSPKRHQVAPTPTLVTAEPTAPQQAAGGEQRNQAVLDFLAFEDSDDDELGQILKKTDIVQVPAEQKKPVEPVNMMQGHHDDEVLQ